MQFLFLLFYPLQFREERMELYHRVTVARDTGLDRVASLDQENAQLVAQLDELKVATKTQVRRDRKQK
jgi:hypothetical protein